MTDKLVSPAMKALAYAETELGVHTVYEEATFAHKSLDKTLTDLSDARDLRRTMETAIEDNQMEIASDERSTHADMSEAGMARHLKIAYSKDPLLHELRSKLQELTNKIEGLEYDKTILETGIKIAIARMSELGGYLMYLSVIKEYNKK